MSGHAEPSKARTQDFAAENLGARIASFRASRGMTPRELALAIGTTPAAVRRWEACTARPTIHESETLRALGMSDITQADTNRASIARLRGETRLERVEQARARRERGSLTLSLGKRQIEVLPAPYVLNGPADQEDFHHTLLQLQVEPLSPFAPTPRGFSQRLALASEVDGARTAQDRLEQPSDTATAWNSNYGSHGWHRYVGRFPPHLVRALLNHFRAGPGDLVLDPFAGSGTTSVECRLLGIPSIGVEISPLSTLIARTKSDFPDNPLLLLALASGLAGFYDERWTSFLSEKGACLHAHDTILARQGNLLRAFPNYEKWLTAEALLGVSIVIEYAATLDGIERDLLLVALSSKMRSIGNVDVDVVRAEYRAEPRRGVDVLRLVRAQLRKMAESVDAMHRSHSMLGSADETTILQDNILDLHFEPESISHVITSPPYGVESLSYLRTHLLSFRCLEPFLNADPYETGAGVIGSEYLDRLEPSWAHFASASVSSTFIDFFERVKVEADPKLEKRTPMMMRFFDDIGRLVERFEGWLKPGGGIALVIGNKRLGTHVIPAHQIVLELFEAHGFTLKRALEHKLKTNNSNSQVPWQERVIQNEYVLICSKQ